MNKMTRGFTIVELIIVIVIIGILAAIGIASYNRIQVESNDSRRQVAVDTILNSLEKYYEKNGEYPYRGQLNPTSNQIALPDYSAVKAALPDLSDEILSMAGYNFYPYTCASSPSCTSVIAGEREARATQYFYYTVDPGYTNGYIQYNTTGGMWGCRITLDDRNPAAVIAWKREQDNKWIFQKTKHGVATIANNGTPVAPTTCTFS